jgi:cell division protein FtsN
MSQAGLFSLNWAQWGLIGLFLVGGGAVLTNTWKSNSCKGSCSASCKKAAENAGAITDTSALTGIEHTGSSPEFPANVQQNGEQAGREVAETNTPNPEITSAPVVQEAGLNPLTASQAKKNVAQTPKTVAAPKTEVKAAATPVVVSNKREIAPAPLVTAAKTADYHLIAASFDSWKKAGVLKESLKKQGVQAEILHKPNTTEYRVSIFKSADKKKVEEMKAKSKVSGTWIAQ